MVGGPAVGPGAGLIGAGDSPGDGANAVDEAGNDDGGASGSASSYDSC